MIIYYFTAGTGESGYPLYSEVTLSGTLFPWTGKAEAYKMAKGRGAKALFYRTEDEARAAMKKAGEKPALEVEKSRQRCCDALDMVAARRRNTDQVGLMYERLYTRSGATPPRDVVTIRCHKSRNKKEEFANTTFFVVNYCPFCGKRIAEED